MKKLIFALVVASAITSAEKVKAQESYSLPANAARVAILDSERIDHNDVLCLSRFLALGCTQAQFTAAGGVGTIYADSLAGRNAFLLTRRGLAVLAAIIDGRTSKNVEALFRRKWATANQAEKDAYCVMRGLLAGCDPFAGN